MNYLLYQAYGHSDILHECLYSLYSLAVFEPECQILIYTDQQAYIKKYAPPSLNISYRNLSQQDINDWKGKHAFVHRLKIMMILDFLKDMTEAVPILYIDTDVTFLRPPGPIFKMIEDNQLLMHAAEGPIGDKKNIILKKVGKYQKSGKKHAQRIPNDQLMYNAGALGFKASDAPLIKEVLHITDAIYEEFPKHIVEQLAFSIVFSGQADRPLQLLNEYLFHYWNLKEFRTILAPFFKANTTSKIIAQKYKNIDPIRLIQPKLKYEQSSFLLKNIKKLFGKWSFPPYEI